MAHFSRPKMAHFEKTVDTSLISFSVAKVSPAAEAFMSGILAAHPEIKRRKAHASMIFVFMDISFSVLKIAIVRHFNSRL